MTVQGGTNNVNVTSASTDNYSSLVAQLAPTTSTINGQVTFTCAGILSNLTVTASPASGSGSYDITVRVNNADSGLFTTCDMTQLPPLCFPSFGSVGSVDINPGDEVNVEIDPNGNPPLANFDWSASLMPQVVFP
jgi:hypothetical protein